MTKKHYEAIAAIIASTRNNATLYPSNGHARGETLEVTASRLADYFTTDNPRFDRARFLQACGVESCNGKHKTVQELSDCKDCAPYFDKDMSQT